MSEQLSLTTELNTSISNIISFSKQVVVKTKTQKTEAIEGIRQIIANRAKIVEFFAESKGLAYKAWKAIVAQEKGFTDQLTEAEKNIRKAIMAFDAAEQARIEEERRKLQAEADEKARREREALLKRADNLKTAEKAEALREQAATITAPVVQVEQEKTKGVTTVTKWKARIIDVKLVPFEWMTPNIDALNKLAAAVKGQSNIPGVEFYEEKSLTIRS